MVRDFACEKLDSECLCFFNLMSYKLNSATLTQLRETQMKNVLITGLAFSFIAGASLAQESELRFEIGDENLTWSGFNDLASAELDGQTLSILGPWSQVDKELFTSVLVYFEEATGVTVEYAGSESFEQQILIDAEAGSPPNIAVFPQPGLAKDMASKGFLEPLGDATADWVRENYAAGQSWVDLGTYTGGDNEDHLYGFFYKVDVKSLVWYVPENFEDAGYEVPATMEELIALSDQIVADGGTPWCIGIGSGGATGWPSTDWVEDMMLRTQPPEVYDQWVNHDIPFNDPRVVGAIETFGNFSRNDDYVAGGTAARFRERAGGPEP